MCGSLQRIGFPSRLLDSAVFDPNINFLRVHIAAEPVSLAHDKIHENHVGEVPHLHKLLDSSLIELTCGVFVTQLQGTSNNPVFSGFHIEGLVA